MKTISELRDVNGRLIAAEGREVTPALIREVSNLGRPVQVQLVSLDQAVFLKDLEKVLHEPLYDKIFCEKADRQRILRQVRKIRIQKALYQELCRLKKSSSYTYRHFLLIAALAMHMAGCLKGLGYKSREAFVYGLLHDLGKTRLSSRILNKKVRLTSAEYKVLRSYPVYSLLLLKYYLGKNGTEACRVAYEHHETLDGKGYPLGIRKISKYTALVAILDIFDALVSDRPYRMRSFTVRGALDKLIMGMHAGKYARLPVRLLVSFFRAGNPNFRTLRLSKTPRDPEPEGNCYGKTA